jgi:hypothetical protein
MTESPQPVPNPPAGKSLAVHWRVLISIALLVHLTAVVAAPMALPPSSELQQNLAATFRPYLNLAYLDHGYRFFAPSPGPSHLVRYELEMPDGTTSTGVFPNKQTEWPRLFYHRHFMLAEKLNDQFIPPEAPAAERAVLMKPFEAVAESYAMHLIETTGARKATLQLVSHELPSPQDMERELPLDDQASYQTLWAKTYEAKP